MTIPIPPTNATEEPTTCIRINELWIPVLLGALQSYLNPPQWENGLRGPYMINPEPVWEGDATDNEEAEQQILEIMAALMAGNCEDVVTIFPSATIMAFGGSAGLVPAGWLLCNGAHYQKADYPDLWENLSGNGTIYQVDEDTFRVPNLQGRVILGANLAHTMGEEGGAETVTLTINQMPTHTHAPPTGSAAFVTNTFPTASSHHFVSSGGLGTMNPNAPLTGGTGGGLPHNNMPPYHVLHYIIKT